YSTGNVSGDEHVGGIAGEVISSSTTIANNAAINQKINESSYVNRIVGDPGYSNVKNNFALDTMTINGGYSSNVGDLRYSGTPKLIDKLTTQETYSADPTGGLGWKFGNDKDNPWKIDEGNGYPYLYWQKIAP
ncbi:MAG: hypothetical protein LBQ52_03280, partial [Helicobacteraceae bacterium]|nr:hypothetical protein [Helicobacteraceae bacterium]